jgi:hypothetical protein
MSTIEISGSSLPSGLMSIMDADDIVPGSPVSYEMCKQIWMLHPLGGKIVEKPISLALGQPRKINVPGPLEERVVEAFTTEWDNINATGHITNVAHVSRAYGVGAVVYGQKDTPTDQAIDPFKLADMELYFNILDPLNTSGSMVTNQNPNAPDFQKPWMSITAAGQPYHRSRSCTLFHGTPIYLEFQGSSFSFSGRSAFLRALFPLKSFIQTMIVNDMVSLKAGLIVATMKQAGSVWNGLMEKVTGRKRDMIREGRTFNVLSIDVDEKIETLNMTNTADAMTTARDNIISDIAAASDTPAILMKDESFAKGLASGDQDMMAVVQYIDSIRTSLKGLHAYFDNIVQHRAWSPAFFTTLVNDFPEEMAGKDYKAWFYEQVAAFKTEWPNLIQEPKSEEDKRNADKLKAIVEVLKTLLPSLDPLNRARAIEWFVRALADMPEFLSGSMVLDFDTLAAYTPPTPAAPGGEGGSDEGGGNGD